MWSRSQLKEKAKFALKQNYWKAVLVSLILAWVAGGTALTTTFDFSNMFDSSYEAQSSDFLDEFDHYEEFDSFEDSIEEDLSMMTEEDVVVLVAMIAGIFIVIFFIVFIIALIISLVWSALIGNPVEMGCSRFFLLNLNQKTDVKEVAFGFDRNYKNVVKVMFFRTLYITLWSMLFWIPGIIKSYEYRMIPYLLAENPNLDKEQAFEISKRMMNGNKWKAFVLDLSFFGWDMLVVASLGILEVFYVGPYRNLTNAALFEQLSQSYGHPANSMPTQDVPPRPIPPQPIQSNPVEVNPYINPTQHE